MATNVEQMLLNLQEQLTSQAARATEQSNNIEKKLAESNNIEKRLAEQSELLLAQVARTLQYEQYLTEQTTQINSRMDAQGRQTTELLQEIKKIDLTCSNRTDRLQTCLNEFKVLHDTTSAELKDSLKEFVTDSIANENKDLQNRIERTEERVTELAKSPGDGTILISDPATVNVLKVNVAEQRKTIDRTLIQVTAVEGQIVEVQASLAMHDGQLRRRKEDIRATSETVKEYGEKLVRMDRQLDALATPHRPYPELASDSETSRAEPRGIKSFDEHPLPIFTGSSSAYPM